MKKCSISTFFVCLLMCFFQVFVIVIPQRKSSSLSRVDSKSHYVSMISFRTVTDHQKLRRAQSESSVTVGTVEKLTVGNSEALSQKLFESKQKCLDDFKKWKQAGGHQNHATPYQHRHNLCRGKALLYSEEKLFLGVFFTEELDTLTAYVYDCLSSSNQSSQSPSANVHDISVFSRAVGPAIVFPRSTEMILHGQRMWKLYFKIHESGKYIVEVKARWLFNKSKRPIYLGGTERRTCDYCEIPRLLPQCESASNVFASPQWFTFSVSKQKLTDLPLLSYRDSNEIQAPNAAVESGRWINFQHTCTNSKCYDQDLFSGNPIALSKQDVKMESILPAQLQTSRWFFQPAAFRYHMYSSWEIQHCLNKVGAANGRSVFVLGDSQARTVWGSISYLAGLGDINSSYLHAVKNYFKEKRSSGMVTRTVENIGDSNSSQPFTFKYIQEWTEQGEEWWNSAAYKSGLLEASPMNVSVFIYNAGFAHKSGQVLQFLNWWRKKASQCRCAEPAKFYLSSVALQGQRNEGWDLETFRKKDKEYRKLFEGAGWKVIEAWEPTQSVGVDSTEEGGSDGFHYSMAPTINMIAMIFYNMLCNSLR